MQNGGEDTVWEGITGRVKRLINKMDHGQAGKMNKLDTNMKEQATEINTMNQTIKEQATEMKSIKVAISSLQRDITAILCALEQKGSSTVNDGGEDVNK